MLYHTTIHHTTAHHTTIHNTTTHHTTIHNTTTHNTTPHHNIPRNTGVEYVVPRHRVAAGILINIPYSIGGLLLTGTAYLIQDNWRLLSAVTTIPAIILFSYYWYLNITTHSNIVFVNIV